MERQKVILGSEIKSRLEGIQYEIISQERPVLSILSVGGYYPTEKSALTSVLQTKNGSVEYFMSLQNGHLDLVKPKKLSGFQKLELADRERIKSITGYDVGTIPLVGLEPPCLFDRKLLRRNFISGGAGDEPLTLKISPKDLLEVNGIIGMFE